jgi:hypothetical protein
MIKKKDFKNISMNGRLAYQLMCVERYLLHQYPTLDFKPMFEILWQVTNGMYWDTFSDYVIDMEPHKFLRFKEFVVDGWLIMTKELYEQLYPTISQLSSDVDDLFETLKDQTFVYAYTIVPKNTHESIDIIFETISFLLKYHIPLPDINLISFSTIDQFNGWGDNFDGTKFSIILNKE